METFDEQHLKFKIPSGIAVCGPSSSGKSTFIEKLIKERERLFSPPPLSVLYAYGEYSSLVQRLESVGISTYSGVPDNELLASQRAPFVLILDDLLLSIGEDRLNDLYIKKNHRLNFCCIFLSQTIFEKKLKTMRSNCHYIILQKAPSLTSSIRILASQIFPGRVGGFMQAYEEATSEPFSNIVIDLHPTTPQKLRIKAAIFDRYMQVFVL